MRPQVKAFRDAASQVSQMRSFSFKEFMEDRGLEDILDDAEVNNRSAKEIAAKVLADCCVTNGTFNHFYIGLLSVITFLKDQFGSLGQGEQQAFQDLVKVLSNPGTSQAIMAWLNTHYK